MLRSLELFLDTLNYPLNIGRRGTPKWGMDQVTTTSLTYVTIVSWTPATGHKGYLEEIAVQSADFTKVQVQVTVNDTVVFTDKTPLSGVSAPFRGLLIEEAKDVKIEVKSSDGTSITVAGSIVGREI
ncbi:MAG: hypothetical protein KO464_07180 [Candidatus Methanofastidiosum sp.]|nr:hypothetical protein [Methanofastidiosum sp.]